LETPDWITVDAPPVHVFDEKEISWRLRATRRARGTLKIVVGKEQIEKTIDSRQGPRYFLTHAIMVRLAVLPRRKPFALRD
jgi:hypothetical protein